MSLKMYVLIKSDLTPAQQAVQAGHALAKFGMEFPTAFRDWQKDSNILIYLSVDSIAHWKQVLDDSNFKHSVFREPHLPYNRTDGMWRLIGTEAVDTAIAVAPSWICQYVLFAGLPLALQKKRWWRR